MADVYEQNLAQKSSVTNSDFIRVVGTDNVSYKNRLVDVKTFMGLNGYNSYNNTINTDLSDCSYTGIGNFIKSAVLETDYHKNRWVYTRITNTGGSVAPFGSASFSIMFNCSSDNYGWAFLMSDSLNTSFIVGRLSAGTWTWQDVWGSIDVLRQIKTKTVTGTTTATGAINMGFTAIDSVKVLDIRIKNPTVGYAFHRGDGYATVFTATNNVMTILSNTSVTIDIFYVEN